jgi:apolipoprotein N-acyltransferase
VLAAIFAGAISVLAFAPVFFFPVLYLTMPVLVWLIDGSDGPRGAARDGWAFGFGYFLANLFWVGEAFLVEAEKFALLMPFAVTILPAGLALIWAGATAIARCFWRSDASRVLVLAITLSLAEWLRGHVLTGLPWNVLGYALTYPIELMQSAALMGVYALTMVAAVIFMAPLVVAAEADRGRQRAAFAKACLIAGLPIAFLAAHGAWILAIPAPRNVPGVTLRIVQPSVPQREKWQPQNQAAIFSQHLEMSATGPDGNRDDLAGVTHVIWPEAAMPFLPLEHPEALSAIGEMLPDGAVLVTGALRREKRINGEQQGFNSLMAFGDKGQLIATYDKAHLVPFGEYLPFDRVLGAIGFKKLTQGLGSFASGPTSRPLLKIPGLPPVAGLICYEVLFPGHVVDRSARPGLIVNVTNDGWFGDTSGPRQHFHQAKVRAVEEGLPVVRAANNGISAIIDPYGRVTAVLSLNAKGVTDGQLPQATGPTPYVRLGDSVFIVLLLLAAAAAWLSQHRRLRSTNHL